MQNNIKICLIGGGSNYTPGIVDSLIKRTQSINLKEIYLLDVEEGKEKQDIIYEFCRKMIDEKNLSIKIYKTLDREEALKNASFVVSMFRVGGNKARLIDEKISLKNKIIADESICACALSECLRTIPVILEIVEDMKRLCPKAFLINLNNIGGMICEAIFNYTDFNKVIGVSSASINLKTEIANILELNESDIELDFAGVSNLVYGLEIRRYGEDYMRSFIISLAGKGKGKTMPFSLDFIRSFSIIPSEKHVFYYKKDVMLEAGIEEFHLGITRGQMLLDIEKASLEYYKNSEVYSVPDIVRHRISYRILERAAAIIDAIYNDKKEIYAVNTKNNGAIPSFECNDSIEASAVIGNFGAKPLAVGKIPLVAKGLIAQIKSFEKICVKAAVEGDYLSAYSALCIHPLIPSEDTAKRVIEDILLSQRAYLPKFSRDVVRIEATKNKKVCKRDCSACKNKNKN
ncbi:MAG: 6-phospho-beta-glucosidase [Sarcina sp.]